MESDESDERYAAKVTVQGAGSDVVNGTYAANGKEVDGAPVWVLAREDPATGSTVALHLYRCALSNGMRRWYISVPPEGEDPGTMRDLDYYYAPSQAAPTVGGGLATEHMPPSTGWQVSVSEVPAAAEPPPRVFPKVDPESDGPPGAAPAPASPAPGVAGSDEEMDDALETYGTPSRPAGAAPAAAEDWDRGAAGSGQEGGAA